MKSSCIDPFYRSAFALYFAHSLRINALAPKI